MVINIEQPEENKSGTSSEITQASAKSIADSISQSVDQNQMSIKNLLFNKLGISNSNNPFICIAHMAFKCISVACYLFSGLTFDSVTVFLLVAIFSVLDFWVVKNVSGRFLASLRWWSVIDDKGEEKWMFESFNQEVKGNPIDSFVFWYGQIATTIFWTLVLFIKILTFALFWVF